MTDEPIRAVDLFCGAGGLSWGLVEALESVAIEADDPTTEVLEDSIELVAVNHWDVAIETHERNHPWATHYHDDVANVDPREVFDEQNADVEILSGGIECTHWSTARGGKPVSEQKRMPAFDFLTWVQKLRPENVLVENVKEFEKWGPIEDDGTPTRNGETFQEWINTIHSLGYSVEWKVLNAADYGDATSRRRLFIIARRNHRPEFPEPTHAEDPSPDSDREPWRSAAEIIDWSTPGDSIWTRSDPLVNNTMRRIAEGIRRHAHSELEPFADVVAELGSSSKDDAEDYSHAVQELQERVVPARLAGVAAEVLDEPFLVRGANATGLGLPHLTKYYGTSTARPVSAPLDTVTAGGYNYAICQPEPYVLGQHSTGAPRAAGERPMPTVTTTSRGISLCQPEPYLLGQHGGAAPRGALSSPVPTVTGDGYIRVVDAVGTVLPRDGYHRGIHSNPAYLPSDRPLHVVTARNTDGYLVTPTLLELDEAPRASDPYLVPFYGERSTQSPRVRSLERPLSTVPASKVPCGVTEPYLVQYHGRSGAQPIHEPAPTLTARDSLALCVPELYPWGLDVRFRMLQPRELAAAQGFPSDYAFAGNKTETVKQIGNAVPVNLAESLVSALLQSSKPDLWDYADGEPAPGAADAAGGAD